MSQDLEQYHDIIEQLKPMINEPEFNQVLNQVAASVPKQKRFLLKMELKRLARPCIRLIDLRGHVDGKCRIYQYEGKDHYLDDVAIEVFERQVRSFGEYTIGVHEAVVNTENNFRVMYKRQQAEKKNVNNPQSQKNIATDYQAKLIEFGNFAQRNEERMNYSVNIELFSELNKSIQATTIDISVSGLKIKVSKEHLFKPGERMIVQFRGLENDHSLDKRHGIHYVVGAVEPGKDDQRLNLKRIFEMPTPTFDKFFERFIHGNKRRYKVNLDNTFDAIQNKTYEQYYIPSFASIPVFIEKNDGVYTPKFILANDCNRERIYFWSNELQDLKIGYLFTDERIRQCLTLPLGQQETYIYVFNHFKNEKVYFYSATAEELNAKPNLKNVFLGYGSRKISWRIYKLQLTTMHPEQSYQPLSIADSVNNSVKRQNQKPAPRLMARLKKLSHIALLTDITDDVGTEHYQKIRINRDQLAQLKIFGHPRNRQPEPVSMFRFKYFNQRRETRFLLRTKILVKFDDIVLEGNTQDISVHGLKMELERFFHGKESSTVQISFPQLQKVTKKYELTELHYTVQHLTTERNILHLHVVENELHTTAKQFFDELIRTNRSKLRAYRDEEEIPGIGEALRNIYSNNVLNVAIFLRKEGVTFLPDAAATWSPPNRLTSLLYFQAEPGNFNLYPLYRGLAGKHDFIQSTMGKLKTSDQPILRELFVAYDPSMENISEAIKSCFTDQFATSEQRRQFISQAMIHGQFIGIKMFLARAGRPDIETLQTELNYVGIYAVHRAKVLEEKLWNVSGVGDLVDVTDEIMRRYDFPIEKIKANHKPPATHKIKQVGIAQLLKS
ncbi:MAG: hypothetical protein ACI88A_004570 [Paraglaciecola sp.]|jgi:hypothetical protein